MEISDYILEIVIACVYLMGLPLFVYGITALHKNLLITRRERKLRRDADRKNLPKPLWPKFKKSMSFTMKKDTRPVGKLSISHKLMFWALYTIGFIVSVAGAFASSWTTILIGISLFFVCIMFSLSTGGKLLKQRDKILERIFKTVDFKFMYGKEAAENPSSVINVVEWRNYIEPEKIEMEIPLSFNDDSRNEFMRHFNQHLSRMSTEAEERTWVPADDHEKGISGWDYGGSKLTVRTVPPLPTKAMFHEDYILNDRCAWSFFPLGLGVEDGVAMKNPENPEEEQNVIGIDVSGEQGKLGSKMGFYVSGKVGTSPQILIGGGTGGGKALSVDTLVPVLVPDE